MLEAIGLDFNSFTQIRARWIASVHARTNSLLSRLGGITP